MEESFEIGSWVGRGSEVGQTPLDRRANELNLELGGKTYPCNDEDLATLRARIEADDEVDRQERLAEDDTESDHLADLKFDTLQRATSRPARAGQRLNKF
jgi:hypothetical protein